MTVVTRTMEVTLFTLLGINWSQAVPNHVFPAELRLRPGTLTLSSPSLQFSKFTGLGEASSIAFCYHQQELCRKASPWSPCPLFYKIGSQLTSEEESQTGTEARAMTVLV